MLPKNYMTKIDVRIIKIRNDKKSFSTNLYKCYIREIYLGI